MSVQESVVVFFFAVFVAFFEHQGYPHESPQDPPAEQAETTPTPADDCQVIYQQLDGYVKARIVRNGVIVETVAGGSVPEGMTCDNWDEKMTPLRPKGQ